MLLDVRFFSVNDFFLVPLCFVLMYAIIRNRATACKDPSIRKYYFQVFYFRIVCVFAFTLITEFYFGGGDTSLYYQGIEDLRAALQDDFSHFSDIIVSSKLDPANPLAPYFLFDNYAYDFTYNYMVVPGNFFVPRLGIVPSLLFFNSYLCICFCFMMFAIRRCNKIIQNLLLLLSISKTGDSIGHFISAKCGFLERRITKRHNLFWLRWIFCVWHIQHFYQKEKIQSAHYSGLLCAVICFLPLRPIFSWCWCWHLTIWIFAETNRLIKDKTLRQIFAFMTFVIGIGAGYFMVQYFTSQETLQQYQLDNIISSAEYQRKNYSIYSTASRHLIILSMHPILFHWC